MKRIYENLKDLISHEMVSNASSMLEEKEANIASASSSIIAGLLGVMLKKGDTPQIENIFREAGNLDFLANTKNIWEEKPTHDQQRVGDDFLQHLLGDKAADFTEPIAKQAGISEVATNRLISMIAPLVAGYFGKKLVKDEWTMPHMMNEIEKQKGTFVSAIPSPLIRAFSLPLTTTASKTTETTTANKKKNKGWIVWVVLIALLLLLFFGWRSCRNNTEVVVEKTTITETVTIPDATNDGTTTLTLPDGVKIKVYKGGVEEKMVNFLLSDEYKKANRDDLKKKWFVFDKINFEFNSAANLMDGSQIQLNNIAAILKAFPDAKIKIGAYADKRGTEDVNMEISKERAKTVEALLEKAGVSNKQIARTEGYGEEYATHNASESDEARAKDRDIAIRFVK